MDPTLETLRSAMKPIIVSTLHVLCECSAQCVPAFLRVVSNVGVCITRKVSSVYGIRGALSISFGTSVMLAGQFCTVRASASIRMFTAVTLLEFECAFSIL